MDNANSDQRNYHIQQLGAFTLITNKGEQPASYRTGVVERGPGRVFAGYFVEIEILGGERLIGIDDNSMVLALRRLQRAIFSRGLRMDCVALSDQWRESGLSANSGWGYYGQYDRLMPMMSSIPDETTGYGLDDMISRVVHGMRIGLA